MKKYFFNSLLMALVWLLTGIAYAQNSSSPADRICGQWMSSEKNLLVTVYRDGATYKGKMTWFKSEDNSKTMEEWTDKHNPDLKLRNRKLLGLVVLTSLAYDARSHTWEGGRIYESRSGKTWDAAVTLLNDEQMKVTGYWHFKFIGRAMSFHKVAGPPTVSTY